MSGAELDPIVFVVDDDPSVRKALARLLASAGHAVETFGSAREFLNRGHLPNTAGCVVLDIRMPGLNGLDLQQELKVFEPPLPIVFITGHGDIRTGVHAMKHGAVDFLTKPVNDQDLLSVVEHAIARSVESHRQFASLVELQRRAGTLTPREREVMALIVRGRSNKKAASELGIVEKTIKVHRARVIEKMGAGSLAELVRMAEKLGEFSHETPPTTNSLPADPVATKPGTHLLAGSSPQLSPPALSHSLRH